METSAANADAAVRAGSVIAASPRASEGGDSRDSGTRGVDGGLLLILLLAVAVATGALALVGTLANARARTTGSEPGILADNHVHLGVFSLGTLLVLAVIWAAIA